MSLLMRSSIMQMWMAWITQVKRVRLLMLILQVLQVILMVLKQLLNTKFQMFLQGLHSTKVQI